MIMIMIIIVRRRIRSEESASAVASIVCLDGFRMIDRMEIFGFDVGRVWEIIKLNKYVPTVARGVDFWILNYLLCKLMNYTQGTLNVLLHAVKP